jgi:VWA domain-containing protein
VLLISAALHITLLAVFFFHFHHPHGPVSLSADRTSNVTLIYTLRSQPSVSGQLTARGNFKPDPNPEGTSAPPIPPSHADQASPPPALALKDQSLAHLRSADLLNPGSPPKINSGEGIVFILDVSGSMYEPFSGATRLAFSRQVLAQRIHALRDGVPFALIVYGESAQRSGPLVPANDGTREAAIHFLARDYDLGGGTNLPSGLVLAAELDMGSIVIVTDGDLNEKDEELLPQVRRILGPAGESPALTIIGIAPRSGTDDDYILQELAAQQGGTYVIAKLAGAPDLLTTTKPENAP